MMLLGCKSCQRLRHSASANSNERHNYDPENIDKPAKKHKNKDPDKIEKPSKKPKNEDLDKIDQPAKKPKNKDPETTMHRFP